MAAIPFMTKIIKQRSGDWEFVENDLITNAVPNDPRNRHCREILALIDAGYKVEIQPPLHQYHLVASEIKAEAQRRIINLTILPTQDQTYWRERQTNMSVRFSELLEKKVGGETLTALEMAEYNGMKFIWDKVKSIRATSDLIESDLKNGEAVDVATGKSVSHPDGWQY